MSDDEVLQSVLADDESLDTTATLSAVHRGFSTTPPQLAADVRAGVTERRLLWVDDGLEAVERSAIEGVERGTVSHQSAPRVVRAGSFVMLVGVVAGLVAGVFGGQSLPVAAGLALGGVAVFGATIALARVQGHTGGGFEHHRLTVETPEELVQLWGDPEALSAVESALAD